MRLFDEHRNIYSGSVYIHHLEGVIWLKGHHIVSGEMIVRDSATGDNKLIARKDYFLSIVNKLALGLLRSCIRVKRYWESYSRSLKTPIHIDYDFSSRTTAIFIDLPRSRPVLYIFYISTQEWYLTPSKTLPKVRKTMKLYKKYSVPNQDSFIAIVAKRSTSGSRAVASSSGVAVISPDRALEVLRRYFAKRYSSLLETLKGRRIYGEMVFLVAMLQEISKQYGEDIKPVIEDLSYLERYAEQGFIVPRDIGPPKS